MRVRLFFYSAIYTLLNLFCLYYIIVFTLIYEKIISSWIQGAFFSLFLDYIIFEIGVHLIQGAIRLFARKYPKARYIIFF